MQFRGMGFLWAKERAKFLTLFFTIVPCYALFPYVIIIASKIEVKTSGNFASISTIKSFRKPTPCWEHYFTFYNKSLLS